MIAKLGQRYHSKYEDGFLDCDLIVEVIDNFENTKIIQIIHTMDNKGDYIGRIRRLYWDTWENKYLSGQDKQQC